MGRRRFDDTDSSRATLTGFRSGFYRCLTGWADAAFELTDAVLCAPAPVGSVPTLSLEPVFRRSHGTLYKALARGEVDAEAMRDLLSAYRPSGWPLVFAVDASTWARCDAETSPERGFYYCASKHSAGQPIVAGWSYQWVTQLDWASDSWTAPLDARRIPPSGDAVVVTADQVKDLVGRLGQSEQTPVFAFDAGYDPIALTDIPTVIVVRIRDDRVFYTDPDPVEPGTVGRPRRHGEKVKLADPTPGRSPTSSPPAPTRATGPSGSPPGTACTPSSPTAATGPTTTSHRSSAAPWFASTWSTCPNRRRVARRRSGYGSPGPASTSTPAGGPTYAASTSSTPSGSSRTPWAGPHHRCARPSRPTAGPG